MGGRAVDSCVRLCRLCHAPVLGLLVSSHGPPHAEVCVGRPPNRFRQGNRGSCIEHVAPTRYPSDEQLADSTPEVRRGKGQQQVSCCNFVDRGVVLVGNGDDHRRLNTREDRCVSSRNLREACADGSSGSVNDAVYLLMSR